MKRALRDAFQSIKGSPLAWELFALAVLLKALFSFRCARRLQHAARSFSLSQTSFTRKISHRLMAGHLGFGREIWYQNKIGWDRYAYALDQSALSRTVILKAPGDDGEKGVMIVYFEYNCLRLLSQIEDFAAFDSQWTVVFATSWSPTDYSLLALAVSKILGPVYVQPCNYAEIEQLRAFHPRISPLQSLPCDWLHPSYYEPKPWNERTIDILMVSNWAPFKRHWEFFKALVDLPAGLHVVCVGQPQDGCDLDNIRNLADHYGVPQEIEYLESIPIETVIELQCDAKLSVIFSLREGCCVAAAESLMAGAVLAMRRNAHVGPKAYINERTGILLDPGKISSQLSEALASGELLDPANWARENIAATKTLTALNQLLAEDAKSAALPWTRDLAQPAWHPYPMLFDPLDQEALDPTYAQLHDSYPDLFAADLATASRR
jgi:glycosyltransferase involved in cell wall biosynthesis